MIVPARAFKITIATKPVDFRKDHDGLAAGAQQMLIESIIVEAIRTKAMDEAVVLTLLTHGLNAFQNNPNLGNLNRPGFTGAQNTPKVSPMTTRRHTLAYPAELRERGVQLFRENRADHACDHAA